MKTLLFRLIIALICFLPFQLIAQGSIKGKVLDFETKKPIERASVYLSGTQVGQSTKADGTYELKDLAPGIYELVFSHIAYKNRVEVIEIKDNDLTINARMAILPVSLETVEVVKQKDKGPRRRALKRFKNFFYGNDYLESHVFINNEDIIQLDRIAGGVLETPQEYILEVENDYLGYQLEYYLKQFRLGEKSKLMLGYPKFQSKEAPDFGQELEWVENRQRAYNGSIRHFFESLINQKLEEEGFIMQMTRDDPESLEEEELELYAEIATRRYQVDSKNLPDNVVINDTEYENIKRINFGEIVEVSYENEFDNSGGYQASIIKMVGEYIYVYTNGVIINPSAIKLFGQWANEGVYNLLPFDFVSNDTLELKDNAERKKLLGDLTALTQTKITEKVYIHSNRDDYYPGETVWLKSYVVAGPNHQPSPLSRNIYVDLVNEKGRTEQSILLKSNQGFADANLELPDDFAAGNYSIQAYTEWMKNEGENYFFKKEILINSPNDKSSDLPARFTNAIDLQFLPESGHLLEGVPNRVAFRATDENGKPVNISGEILTDNSSKGIRFKTEHNGMGFFEMIPDARANYQIRVDGSSQYFAMPEVDNSGAILQVDPFYSPDQIKLVVKTNIIGLDPFIISQSRGWLNYTANVKLANGIGELLIDRSMFPEGINHITLFTEDGDALAERVFFKRGEEGIKIALSLADSVYSRRSGVNLKMKVTDQFGNPIQGNFSLSVNNQNRLFKKEAYTNIKSHLLLDSDLAGSIINPAYYFTEPNELKDQQLDLVMMTHGWTRFEWDEIEELKERDETFSYETGLTVTGRMFNGDGGKAAKNATLSYINNSAADPEMLTATTDRKGRFSIPNVSIINDAPFLMQGMTAKGSTIVSFEIDSLPFEQSKLSSFRELKILEKAREQQSLRPTAELEQETDRATFIVKDNKDFLSTIQVLESVIIEADRRVEVQRKSIWGEPSTSLDVTKIVPANQVGLFTNFLKGRIPGVQITDNGPAVRISIRGGETNEAEVDPLTGLVTPGEGGPLLYLDNVLTDIIAINSIPANQFERVEVFKGPDAAIFGANSADGAILFFTKPNYVVEQSIKTNGVQSFIRPGYHQTKTYYKPVYDNSYSGTGVPDFRIALHWEPFIVTDKNGEAFISWYNSDDLDQFVIRVEGISNEGKAGYAEAFYKIEDETND